jgi:hypothetical protein
VRKGESLTDVIKKRNIAVQEIVCILNVWCIVAAAAAAAAAACHRVYPVRKGESLTDIIKKRNITVQEMKDLNPGVNVDRLKGESSESTHLYNDGVPSTYLDLHPAPSPSPVR